MPLPEGKNPAERAEIKEWLKDRNKFPTGFCNEHGKPGQHEGQKPRSKSGKPMPTCEFFTTCPCSCHYALDKMFKIGNLERKLIPNPEYVPERAEFVIPEVVIDPLGDVAVAADGPMTPPDVEQTVAVPPVPAAAPLAVRRTDTGRAARGGLEAQVWDACRNLTGDAITPKLVGDYIVDKYKIPTPSSGAINAVWDRWTKLGFGTQAKKPNRFTGFTGDGTWEELARLKGSVKRQKKLSEGAARRSFRRVGA